MLDRIEAFITHELDSRQIPGALIAVVRPGEPVWSRGIGIADVDTGEPMTPSTPFSIQSITKTFVGTAIMQLQEKGLHSVEDPVAKHLPGVVQNEWEAENPVLIRQLLTHTSGLPVGTAGGPTGGPCTLEEYVRLVAKTTQPPGGEAVYANWGYDLLGLLIETLSGETWYDYISRHICESLGMRSTSVHPPENAAYGTYLSAIDGKLHKLGRAQWPVDPSDPAGGLVSTVEDLALFAAAHLAGGGWLMSPDTTAQMHAPAGSGMALGFRITRSNRRRLLCHGGDGSGFTNFLGLYPDDGIAVVLSLSRGGVQAARSVIANTVLATLIGEDLPTPGPSRRADLPLDGLYRSSFWDIEVAVETADDEVALRPLAGLGVSDGSEPSVLRHADGGAFIGEGSMFHGFDVTVGEDDSFYGGLYPFRFERVGEVPTPVTEPIDESADLIGRWTGAVETPMGALALTVDVRGTEDSLVSTPFAQDSPLEDFEASAGRVSGRFTLTVPTVGEMVMYPRLEVRSGNLKGPVYAQGWFGELPMLAELEKA